MNIILMVLIHPFALVTTRTFFSKVYIISSLLNCRDLNWRDQGMDFMMNTEPLLFLIVLFVILSLFSATANMGSFRAGEIARRDSLQPSRMSHRMMF